MSCCGQASQKPLAWMPVRLSVAKRVPGGIASKTAASLTVALPGISVIQDPSNDCRWRVRLPRTASSVAAKMIDMGLPLAFEILKSIVVRAPARVTLVTVMVRIAAATVTGLTRRSAVGGELARPELGGAEITADGSEMLVITDVPPGGGTA